MDVNFKENLSKTQTCLEPPIHPKPAINSFRSFLPSCSERRKGGGVELYNHNEVNEEESQV